MQKDKVALGLLRIFLGFIFLWAFLDKLLGLGFATKSADAWIRGGSPTLGFLKNAAKGPLANFYHAIAGTPVVNWMFMLALLLIGLGLILGIAMNLTVAGGTALFLMMWSAVLPPSSNPLIDDHIIYVLVLFVLLFLNAGDYLGLGKKWKALRFVKKNKLLK